MTFTSETTSGGLRDRSFTLAVEGRTVPGVLWTPDHGREPWPLVLLGHGGGGHKRMRWQTGMAERLARGYGIASVAIDAVEHGDRLAGGPILDRDAAWAERQKRRNNPDEALYEHMIADWKATLDFVLGIGAPSAAIGYFGLSMGTRYGLPFLAMEPRIRVAVLGLNGIVPGEPTTPDHIMVKRLLAKAAARMSIPIHFIVQDGDELFPRENSLSLFDAIASSDKHLHLNPGGHGDVPVSEMEFAAAFLASHLKPVTTI